MINNEVLAHNPEPDLQELARFFGDQRFEISWNGKDAFSNAYTASNPWDVRPAVEMVRCGLWRPVTVYVGNMPAQISWLHNINEDLKLAASGSYLKTEFRGKELKPIRFAICERIRAVYEEWGYVWVAGVRKDNPSGQRWTEDEWRCIKAAQVNGHCVDHEGRRVDLWVYVGCQEHVEDAVDYAKLIGWPATPLNQNCD